MSCLGSGLRASVPTGMLRALLDRRRDLGAGQTAALAGLGALVDLDLDVAHPAQVGAGDAEVAAGGLQALPLHVPAEESRSGPPSPRRGHGEPGAALDARREEVLAGGAERGGGMADGGCARWARARRSRSARARRAGRAGASRRRRRKRAARWRRARRGRPAPAPSSASAARRARRPSSQQRTPRGASARAAERLFERGARGEREPRSRRGRRPRGATSAGLSGAPWTLTRAPRRRGARPREAPRHGERDVVEQRRVAAQALQRPGHRLPRQLSPTRSSEYGALVAGDEEVVESRQLPGRHAVDRPRGSRR